MNFYETLRVPFDADTNEIKHAFRRLSLKYHPDVSNDTLVDYTYIIEAYQVLVDNSMRKDYDNKLKKINPEFFKIAQRPDSIVIPYNRVEYTITMENILKTGMKMSKRFRHADYLRSVGQDIVLNITPTEAQLGCAAILDIPGKKLCPVCGGLNMNCYRCGGRRYIKLIARIKFYIPTNVANNDSFDIDIKTANFIDNITDVYFSAKKLIVKIRFI